MRGGEVRRVWAASGGGPSVMLAGGGRDDDGDELALPHTRAPGRQVTKSSLLSHFTLVSFRDDRITQNLRAFSEHLRSRLWCQRNREQGRKALGAVFRLGTGNPGVEDSCACHELCVIVAGGGKSDGPTVGAPLR